MNEPRDLADLLAVARETLLERVLPVLPEATRYEALMIGNALGIAMRALELDPASTRAGRDRAAALVAALPDLALDDGDLHAFDARLAAAIRRGSFDEGALRDPVYEHLLATVNERLRIDNPKALAG